MTAHAPPANTPTRPNRERTQVCIACSEGHHEQALVNEQCGCPCHPAHRAESEVAA